MNQITADTQIQVMLVDDHALVLDGLQARLNQETDIEVVGRAKDGEEALALVGQLNPHIMLMDVSMPKMNSMEAIEHLSEKHPQVKVLILTMHDNREYMMHLMKKGARGYLLKDVESEEMIHAIKTVYQGGTYICQAASQTLFSGEQGQQEVSAPEIPADDNLTPREKTVLALVSQGQSNKAIANQLHISVRTVETHRQNIKQKLDIHSTAELTKYAVEHRII